jgi:hypothetical protein
MPSQQVPSFIVMPRAVLVQTLNDLKVDLTNNTAVALKLYQNNVTPVDTTLLSAYTEANFGGYAPVTIVTASWNGAYLDPVGRAYMDTGLSVFICNGNAANTIYGAILVQDTVGGTRATATCTVSASVVTSITITNSGTGYQIPPIATFSGGGGTGATATFAVNSSGNVSTATITSGGAAYTAAPTISLEYPYTLVASYPFPAGVPMALSTDALPVVAPLIIPPITATP